MKIALGEYLFDQALFLRRSKKKKKEREAAKRLRFTQQMLKQHWVCLVAHGYHSQLVLLSGQIAWRGHKAALVIDLGRCRIVWFSK